LRKKPGTPAFPSATGRQICCVATNVRHSCHFFVAPQTLRTHKFTKHPEKLRHSWMDGLNP
jgi:hypothetical protein